MEDFGDSTLSFYTYGNFFSNTVFTELVHSASYAAFSLQDGG
ncbi:hypothetical protein EV06_1799 [Prochlorococcus sp. MIT 0602]|nr:hypothetical protein EV06_1799 [Prochlorococcus sp. MIT 0602]KGG15832.1 hypothetical protein EV07_1798 [Prochlorococcus sp. MIT 0603]